MRAGCVATTVNAAPGNVPTTPVALIEARMVPSRTGSAMTGIAGSASVSCGAERPAGRKSEKGGECEDEGCVHSPDFTGLRALLEDPAAGRQSAP